MREKDSRMDGTDRNSNMARMSPDSGRMTRARRVASLFDLEGPFEVYDFEGKGNINRETFLIVSGPPRARSEYLLQLLNSTVFPQPRLVMNAMIACIRAQEKALAEGALKMQVPWETIRLVPTKAGMPYLEIPGDGELECWRLMSRIADSRSYRSLREIPDPRERLGVAEEAGRGLGLFRILTASMDASSIGCPLPGYRNTRLYYDQLESVLAGTRTLQEAAGRLPADPALRGSTQRHFLIQTTVEEHRRRLRDPQLDRYIHLALEQKPFACSLHDKLQSGHLRTVVVHGDTKLDNYLFSTLTGDVKAIVDLDTVMPHTWLSDWGDLARSLVNIAGEREPDLEKVKIDMDVFRALAKGFLGTGCPIGPGELDLMAEAPQIMALELGVRFLTDYLRGDSYFRLAPADPRDLNRTRALVQFSVFDGLRRTADIAKRHIREWSGA